jgi:hypothetical protein
VGLQLLAAHTDHVRAQLPHLPTDCSAVCCWWSADSASASANSHLGATVLSPLLVHCCCALTRCLPPAVPRVPVPCCSKVPKKVTAIAFTSDGAHVLAADKFGDVLVADTQRPAGGSVCLCVSVFVKGLGEPLL